MIFFGCINDNTVIINAKYDYSIDQMRSCFCPNSGKMVKLFVAADTISNAIWLSDGSYLTREERASYRTLKGLIDETNRWDSSNFNINVRYDSVYGYPAMLSIYPKDTTLKDVGVSYKTFNYKYN